MSFTDKDYLESTNQKNIHKGTYSIASFPPPKVRRNEGLYTKMPFIVMITIFQGNKIN